MCSFPVPSVFHPSVSMHYLGPLILCIFCCHSLDNLCCSQCVLPHKPSVESGNPLQVSELSDTHSYQVSAAHALSQTHLLNEVCREQLLSRAVCICKAIKSHQHLFLLQVYSFISLSCLGVFF